MSTGRSTERPGDEGIIRLARATAFQTPADTIASGASASPYNGDTQHEGVKSGPSGDLGGGEARGMTTALGTSILVHEGSGGEGITLNHHSGAGVRIENDGSIYLSSSSKRGIGLLAGRGDVAIAASEIVLNAQGGLTIKCNGPLVIEASDIVFNAKGSLTTRVGSLHETINGNATREVGKDNNVLVGGINRSTVAGDERHQVTGSHQFDIGTTLDIRAGANTTIQSGDNFTVAAAGDSLYSAQGKTGVISDGDIRIHTSGALDIDAGGSASIAAGGTATLSGSPTRVLGSTTTVTGSTITLATSTLLAPDHAGTGSGPGPVSPNPDDAQAPAKPEVADANTIVDEITSARLVPEYPFNAKYDTEERGSIGIVGHDEDPASVEAYDQYSSKNKGTMYPASPSSYGGGSVDTESYGSYDQAPPGGITSDDLVGDPPTSDLGNYRVEGSSLSELTGAPLSHPIPESRKKEVLAAHAVVIQNIIAPLRAAGFNFTVTSAYRNSRPNHITGYAVDLQVPGRIFAKHVEIATYAAKNLPCAQVFLERSGSGFSHVHIRAHPPGASGKPSLLTCGDPRCRSKVAGINPEYLTRRGVKG